MEKFIPFSTDITTYSLPDKFNYPFNYSPHPLAETAVKELQNYLCNQTDFVHDFGIKNINKQGAIGKMFGVLVIKTKNNQIGYLTAFSGKLAEKTLHKYFVPPVFDLLDKDNFYLKHEENLNQINSKIETLENDSIFFKLKKEYIKIKNLHQNILKEEKDKIKNRRKHRKTLGQTNNQLNINEEFYINEYSTYLNEKTAILKNEFEKNQLKIDTLKKERKQESAWGQQEIFKRYKFLNALGNEVNLIDIFKETTQNIPAGAGECCAPKLLQYAYLNNLTPITMAEFWWGKSLSSSVRKHSYYYPACNVKCKPILTHMLQGLNVDINPLIDKLNTTKKIEIIYEDDAIAVINKPHELLSVPGKEIEDSVYTRIKKMYPDATGPLLVHRLDMSTSGILLIAKNKEAHKHLQAQFINKTIRKKYIALLDGALNKTKGEITLPLRVDLEDRPKQLVCYEHGKKALTTWELIEIKNNKSRVHFHPITGRTHQLRVHAAHVNGLDIPILGDDLYGKEEKRLYLHAAEIQFRHPITFKEITFTIDPPF